MKITIEPTQHDQPTVSVSIHGDDHGIDRVFYDLIRPALMAFGFHRDNIAEYIEDK